MARSSVLLWLFLLLGSYAATPSTGVTVRIDADKGNDTSGCVSGLSSYPCQNRYQQSQQHHLSASF